MSPKATPATDTWLERKARDELVEMEMISRMNASVGAQRTGPTYPPENFEPHPTTGGRSREGGGGSAGLNLSGESGWAVSRWQTRRKSG